MQNGLHTSMLLSRECALEFMKLPSGFFTIAGREFGRLNSLSLCSYCFFKSARPEVCGRQNGQVGGVLVEGNGVFDQCNGLCLIAECGIRAIGIDAGRLTIGFRPMRSEVGRLLKIGSGLSARLEDAEFAAA